MRAPGRPHTDFFVGLPKSHRLKHWRDFQTVYLQGKRYHGRFLVLIALAKDRRSPTQIGISISRKVSKKAVVRNQIKRRLRHIFRGFLPDIKDGWNLVIAVRHCASECEYEHFLRELEKLLIQAEVLHGH